MKTEYCQELVLQLPGSSLDDYDAMIELENMITVAIGNCGDVDGIRVTKHSVINNYTY